MRKRTVWMEWVPMWSDKWLCGSTRLELEPDERSVFVDFLMLASKDDGWVRANETVGYSHTQLAGMLVIPIELLKRAIEKFVKYNKLEKYDGEINEIYKIKKWEQYQLTGRQKRKYKELSPEKDSRDKDETGELPLKPPVNKNSPETPQKTPKIVENNQKQGGSSAKTEHSSAKTEHSSEKTELLYIDKDKEDVKTDKDTNTKEQLRPENSVLLNQESETPLDSYKNKEQPTHPEIQSNNTISFKEGSLPLLPKNEGTREQPIYGKDRRINKTVSLKEIIPQAMNEISKLGGKSDWNKITASTGS